METAAAVQRRNAAAPVLDREPEPLRRFPIWLAVAGIVLVAAIIAVAILLATHAR